MSIKTLREARRLALDILRLGTQGLPLTFSWAEARSGMCGAHLPLVPPNDAIVYLTIPEKLDSVPVASVSYKDDEGMVRTFKTALVEPTTVRALKLLRELGAAGR